MKDSPCATASCGCPRRTKHAARFTCADAVELYARGVSGMEVRSDVNAFRDGRVTPGPAGADHRFRVVAHGAGDGVCLVLQDGHPGVCDGDFLGIITGAVRDDALVANGTARPRKQRKTRCGSVFTTHFDWDLVVPLAGRSGKTQKVLEGARNTTVLSLLNQPDPGQQHNCTAYNVGGLPFMLIFACCPGRTLVNNTRLMLSYCTHGPVTYSPPAPMYAHLDTQDFQMVGTDGRVYRHGADAGRAVSAADRVRGVYAPGTVITPELLADVDDQKHESSSAAAFSTDYLRCLYRVYGRASRGDAPPKMPVPAVYAPLTGDLYTLLPGGEVGPDVLVTSLLVSQHGASPAAHARHVNCHLWSPGTLPISMNPAKMPPLQGAMN